jgi:hypothetical protein
LTRHKTSQNITNIKENEMNRTRRQGCVAAAIVLTLLLALFGCGDNPGSGPTPTPEGINGFPATLSMGVPFDLRKAITINLPDAPGKTFDDIIWASNTSGTAFASTLIVIEDGLIIPVTFFHDDVNQNNVTVYAIVKDGEGEGQDYTKIFQTTIGFPLNPFIGAWSGSDGKTWTFKTDGTYSINSATNDGSFAVWSGRPGRKFLITVSGDPETITVESVTSGTNGLYTPYCFEQTGNTIKITPIEFDYTDATNKQDPMPFDETGTPITLTRQSGAPAALDLSANTSSAMMLGTWTGGFAAAPFDPATSTAIGGSGPSPFTYYADGRNHTRQYEGAWLKRGAVFATVGNDGRRWDPPALASWDKVLATRGEIAGTEVVRIHELRDYSRSTNTSLFWRLVNQSPPPPPDDPNALVNPFIGVWSVDGEYWQFGSNGTGGTATTEAGPFPDTFSFFIYPEQGVEVAVPSEGVLVMLDDSEEGVDVTSYEFLIEGNNATLTKRLSKTELSPSPMTLERKSGAPSPLGLTNRLIGEWEATWTVNAAHKWSLKYRTDGTVKTYHHGSHQFENGYALRHNTLVIFGGMRFGVTGSFAGMGITSEIAQKADKYEVTENQINPPANATTGAAVWTYTIVGAAEWQ